MSLPQVLSCKTPRQEGSCIAPPNGHTGGVAAVPTDKLRKNQTTTPGFGKGGQYGRKETCSCTRTALHSLSSSPFRRGKEDFFLPRRTRLGVFSKFEAVADAWGWERPTQLAQLCSRVQLSEPLSLWQRRHRGTERA